MRIEIITLNVLYTCNLPWIHSSSDDMLLPMTSLSDYHWHSAPVCFNVFCFCICCDKLILVLHIQQVYLATRQLSIMTHSKYGMSIKVEAHLNKGRLDYLRIIVLSVSEGFAQFTVLLFCVYWYRSWYSVFWRGTSQSAQSRVYYREIAGIMHLACLLW